MSVQFGRCSLSGTPPLVNYSEEVARTLTRFGPDNSTSYHSNGISLLFHALYTTKESKREDQPYVSRSGVAVMWDGRLDNRAELIRQCGGSLSVDSTDVSIVAESYERWGTDCFARLIGDWALSIWNPNERLLILAKDPIGTRHLYYSTDKDGVTWGTILDPLVLFAGKTFALDEEYIAGWLAFYPAVHLTPYVGIHSVPASCFVSWIPRGHQITKYWDFDPGRRIRYRRDAEYEEHFRTVFAEAVQRRLRSDAPVLAELSGGMDSSSIVCMADRIMARGNCEVPRVDTISYYDDSEPNWNERPYFTKVEEKRGRTGCHINVGSQMPFRLHAEMDGFSATPASTGRRRTEAHGQFAGRLISQGHRVVLSGVGGDEVMGGVPTPIPELMDLLAAGRFQPLAHQLKDWALNKRKPWFHLLLEAVREFFPPSLVGVPKYAEPPNWLQPSFVESYRLALTGYPSRVKLFGPLPSFQDHLSTLEGLRRQLACVALSSEPPYEKSYPYLDRDLLEFIYAIPREQLVRPGQRRSLMRRALAEIVPDEILNRKRKAFVIRAPMVAMSIESATLLETSRPMISACLGIVDARAFREAVQRVRQGQEVRLVSMMRTLDFESWLRTTTDRGIWTGGRPELGITPTGEQSLRTNRFHTRVQLAD